MKCIQMQYMKFWVLAGQNQSHAAEISVSYAAHLTRWKLHFCRLTQLDRTERKKATTVAFWHFAPLDSVGFSLVKSQEIHFGAKVKFDVLMPNA